MIIPCAQQIKMARAGLRWSQAVLSDKSGLSPETIKRVEQGKNVTRMTLELIAKAFYAAGVTFEPYDADAFNDTGPIVRMRLPVAVDFRAYGSHGR